MRTKSRLLALVGLLGLVALSGAASIVVVPIETFCLCACPDGTILCVGSIDGDCVVPCAQAMQFCPSDSGSCGDSTCGAGEDAFNCPEDCGGGGGTCGNGTCEFLQGECDSNCPQDCSGVFCQ